MSDPTNLNQTMAQKVATKLADIGVPEAKHAEKIEGAQKWWTLAALFIFLTVLFCVPPMRYVLRGHDVSTIIAILLLAPAGVCLLVTLFCASQADGEATKAFLATVRGMIPFGRSDR